MVDIGLGWGFLVLVLEIGFVLFWCSESDKFFVLDGIRDCVFKNMIYYLLVLVFKVWELKKNFFC